MITVAASESPKQSDNDLLSIGEFSRLSGLSIGALRHYDSVDLLRPAAVDETTSYRRYRRGQLEEARDVAQLRALEVPLEEIRAALDGGDRQRRRRTLTRHRDRVHARVTRLHWILHQLTHLTDSEAERNAMPATAITDQIDAATQKSLASSLFNRVWELLEQPDRSLVDDEELVNAAHASRYFWTLVGDTQNLAIGEWQLSRVYAVLGRAEPAVHHARRCQQLAESLPEVTWLQGSAFEALSRAYAVAGDRAAAREWRAKAMAQLELISDPDERDIVARDISTLPVDD